MPNDPTPADDPRAAFKGIPRDELGAQADVEASGGTFGTYLSQLRRNGLAEVDGEQIRAGDFMQALR